MYLNKYGYKPSKNQIALTANNEKSIHYQTDLRSMLKEFQRKYKLPVTGKLNHETLKLMNTPRCGVKDHPLAYTLTKPWPKKSFTWKLSNRNLPSFDEEKTREELRKSFNDWVKYAPIEFKEVSQYEKADFDLAFYTDGSDGPSKTLAYAYFPTDGRIRFDSAEPWTLQYDGSNINLRIVATHEIGHALGLDHSNDPSSIMAPYYQFIQPQNLLPEDDRIGIQKLYGTKTPNDNGGNDKNKILWNGNWAHACDFHEKNLANVRIAAELCGPKCAETSGCTHFTWTRYDSGTCWMKTGDVSKDDAFYTNDQSMVCGVRNI